MGCVDCWRMAPLRSEVMQQWTWACRMFGLCVHNICYCRGNPIARRGSICQIKFHLWMENVPLHRLEPSNWPVFHSKYMMRVAFLDSTVTADLCGDFVISFLYISFDIFSGSKNGKMWKFDDHQRSCCCGLGILFIVKQPTAKRTGSDNTETEIKFSCVSLLPFLL